MEYLAFMITVLLFFAYARKYALNSPGLLYVLSATFITGVLTIIFWAVLEVLKMIGGGG